MTLGSGLGEAVMACEIVGVKPSVEASPKISSDRFIPPLSTYFSQEEQLEFRYEVQARHSHPSDYRLSHSNFSDSPRERNLPEGNDAID